MENLNALTPISLAARKLGVSEATVRYYTRTGALACVRDVLGRRYIPVSELETFARLRRRELRTEVR